MAANALPKKFAAPPSGGLTAPAALVAFTTPGVSYGRAAPTAASFRSAPACLGDMPAEAHFERKPLTYSFVMLGSDRIDVRIRVAVPDRLPPEIEGQLSELLEAAAKTVLHLDHVVRPVALDEVVVLPVVQEQHAT